MRRSVTDKLNAVTPSGGAPWCSTLRSALHERHWPSGPSEPPQAEAELPTPAEPSTNLLAVIRCAARSVEPGEPSILATRRVHPLLNEERVMKFAPPASQYSVALAKAEHPDLTPSRISRLVDRMVHKHEHDACGECGSLIGRYHWRESDYDNDYDDGLGCACGEEITSPCICVQIYAQHAARTHGPPSSHARYAVSQCQPALDGGWFGRKRTLASVMPVAHCGRVAWCAASAIRRVMRWGAIQ